MKKVYSSDDERQKKLKVAFDLIVEIAIRALRKRGERDGRKGNY